MKIGDFARMGQVSVRMLRHYDAIGLLEPDRVDEWTGHRSYTTDQLARLHRIVAMRELGFGLDDIRRLMDEPDPGVVRLALAHHAEKLESDIHRATSRLTAVSYRLKLIEKQDCVMQINHDFVVKTLPATRIASRTTVVARQPEIADVIGPLFGEIANLISAAGGCPEYGLGIYDAVEDGLQVTASFICDLDAVPQLTMVELPEVEAVTTMHHGHMSDAPVTWQAMSEWMESNHYEAAGPCRELHLSADGDDQTDWVTEFQQPVVRVRA